MHHPAKHDTTVFDPRQIKLTIRCADVCCLFIYYWFNRMYLFNRPLFSNQLSDREKRYIIDVADFYLFPLAVIRLMRVVTSLSNYFIFYSIPFRFYHFYLILFALRHK